MVFGYFMRFLTAPLLILRLYFGQREIAGIQKPADVIKAENNIRGFGISFSKNNLDVDGNGLTDIAIGSYLSDNVVVLKRLPSVWTEIEMDGITSIDINNITRKLKQIYNKMDKSESKVLHNTSVTYF